MSTQRTHLLVVLDGWGLSPIREGNSVSLASTPNFDRYWKRFPHAQLEAFGPAVGLPDGQMGGSEVGHLNIGAGRVVRQDMSEIDSRIESGSFYENKAIEAAIDNAIQRKSCLHLMGLLSDGGVHSAQTHLYALLDMARKKGLKNVQVHGFLDGRDVAPQSAQGFIAEAETVMGNLGVGRFASIHGRYYPMDRDGNWDRIERAYKAIVRRDAPKVASAEQAVSAAYAESITDEFLLPVIIDHSENRGVVDGDSVVHFNFRSDRAKQLTRAFTEQSFSGFERGLAPSVHYVCFKKYDDDIAAPVAFEKPILTNTMAEFLSNGGHSQLHVAESEKFNHVTFFFNGERMRPFSGEDRITVPSPDVGTYDKKPEMSAIEITGLLKDALARREHDFVVLNLANCDMVGHSGKIAETTQAVECVDTCLGEIVDQVLAQDGMALITADHGNAEQMIDTASDAPWTAHTLNPVPFIMADPRFKGRLREYGALCDIAPTLLDVMGLSAPDGMDAQSMIANAGGGSDLQKRFLGA